ncbi:DUF2004 domain-containing protein [Capnocytophaga sputigena]|uniref:DUF2004 domain-containing protein n=1 Tax=Capnocytophaga sputigena TaxID=1019 RepID=UPI0028E77B3E|nr:DUF2004 domain-containing protein [Capnocytophaga sputigena]
MTTYELPYFGKVTLSEDNDYHEIEDVDINGSSVSITIDCMGETPSKAQGTAIEQLLAHLPELDQQIRKEFIKEYRSDKESVVKDYVQKVEEMAGEQGEELLTTLELINLNILTSGTEFAIFDYALPEITDEILVVRMDKERKIKSFMIYLL